MKIITDIFAYAKEHLPKYNTISISGYHIREAGSTAAQEIAFTLADAMAYVDAALAAGLKIDDFAPRLSFFFACHSDLFEEVAKFRAARRIWARIVKERFGAKDAKSMLLRFHTQTGGVTLTAQQPENNIVRTAIEALAAVLGGTQSLHTNAFDEALALPTEKSAEIALRTQQIIAFESGATATVDPLAGSYYVEFLTDEMEKRATEIMTRIESMGGSVRCVETGFFKEEIARAAYEHQLQIERQERIIVGVNKFTHDGAEIPQVLKVDPALETQQVAALQKIKSLRDNMAVAGALEKLETVSRDGGNVVYPVLQAVEAYATVGEIAGIFRKV
jgi:methylmalonyl-CoA mutase N-terminal domain/subunit